MLLGAQNTGEVSTRFWKKKKTQPFVGKIMINQTYIWEFSGNIWVWHIMEIAMRGVIPSVIFYQIIAENAVSEPW